MSRPAIEARRRGATPCSVPDLAKLAIALNVEPETFFLDPDDAIRWVLDHRPSVLGQRDVTPRYPHLGVDLPEGDVLAGVRAS